MCGTVDGYLANSNRTRETCRVDFLLSGGDLAWAIGLAALLGALGGFTSDLVDPLKQSGDEISSDLENRLTLPHHFKATAEDVGTVDFGFAGPMIVGAVAAQAASESALLWEPQSEQDDAPASVPIGHRQPQTEITRQSDRPDHQPK